MNKKINLLKGGLNELKSWLIIFKKPDFYYKYSFYLIFAFVTILLFLLFRDTGNLLKFDLTALNKWWTYFTHSYFHDDWSHLSQNLQGYLVLTSLLYVLYYKFGIEKLLRKAYIIIFLTMPIITALMNYLAHKLFLEKPFPPMSGSSDIVSSLIGLSFYSIIILLNLRNRYDKGISLLVYLSSVLIFLRFEPSFAYALLIIFIPNYLWILFKTLTHKLQISSLIYFVLLFISIAVYTISIFPKEIVSGNSVINTFSHLIGLFYGLYIGYLIVLRAQSKNLKS